MHSGLEQSELGTQGRVSEASSAELSFYGQASWPKKVIDRLTYLMELVEKETKRHTEDLVASVESVRKSSS